MKIKSIADRDYLESKSPDITNGLSTRLFGGKIPPPLERFASSFLRFSHLNDVYHQVETRIREDGEDESIFASTLEILGSRLEVSDHDLERIPEDGPLLVVANHPLGGLDGLALMNMILKRRPDCKLLANSILERFEAFRPYLFPVDVLGEENASSNNA
ncbi:MAG: hypothetical protein VCA36_07460, partial [Opitutales bacterium]